MGAKGLCTCCLHSLCAPGPGLSYRCPPLHGVAPSLHGTQHVVRQVPANAQAALSVHRGVGAMEIVAMDMKVSGMYIARQLSFSGVTFRIEEIPLDPTFELVYNRAALLVSWLARGL